MAGDSRSTPTDAHTSPTFADLHKESTNQNSADLDSSRSRRPVRAGPPGLQPPGARPLGLEATPELQQKLDDLRTEKAGHHERDANQDSADLMGSRHGSDPAAEGHAPSAADGSSAPAPNTAAGQEPPKTAESTTTPQAREATAQRPAETTHAPREALDQHSDEETPHTPDSAGPPPAKKSTVSQGPASKDGAEPEELPEQQKDTEPEEQAKLEEAEPQPEDRAKSQEDRQPEGLAELEGQAEPEQRAQRADDARLVAPDAATSVEPVGAGEPVPSGEAPPLETTGEISPTAGATATNSVEAEEPAADEVALRARPTGAEESEPAAAQTAAPSETAEPVAVGSEAVASEDRTVPATEVAPQSDEAVPEGSGVVDVPASRPEPFYREVVLTHRDFDEIRNDVDKYIASSARPEEDREALLAEGKEAKFAQKARDGDFCSVGKYGTLESTMWNALPPEWYDKSGPGAERRLYEVTMAPGTHYFFGSVGPQGRAQGFGADLAGGGQQAFVPRSTERSGWEFTSVARSAEEMVCLPPGSIRGFDEQGEITVTPATAHAGDTVVARHTVIDPNPFERDDITNQAWAEENDEEWSGPTWNKFKGGVEERVTPSAPSSTTDPHP